MSVDVVTLALAKAYADELVANGGDPEKTEQIIRDKIDEVLGEIGPIGESDWNAAEGEPGYIKNKTHYDISTSIPKGQDFWNGPTGTEEWFNTEALLEGRNTYFVSDEEFTYEDLQKITKKDLLLNVNGQLQTGENLLTYFSLEPIVSGKFYNFNTNFGPLILIALEDTDLSSFFGVPITCKKGVMFTYPSNAEEKIFVSRLNFKKIKQLDLKYIPEVAFGKIEAQDMGKTATITITDREGQKQVITINDGKDGESYTLTETDKAQIKTIIYDDIMRGEW